MNRRDAHYRGDLPQLDGQLFITDGGLETVFVFQEQIELPLFAAFHLLTTSAGIERLKTYYRRYIALARQYGTGIILDTPTWRASAGWGEKLGYDARAMRRINQTAVALLADLRARHAAPDSTMLLNGVIGPQDDGYQPSSRLSAAEAEAYHEAQVQSFAAVETDMITAVTMTYVDEAVGIVRAALASDVPVAVSFTVETDGRLPDGTSLAAAIDAVDAATNEGAAYFMINCAHPSHFDTVLTGGRWMERIVGVRANASCKSHAELDEATELDDGDPADFARRYRELRTVLPQLAVVGGCCGTDHRHVGAVCESLLAS